MSFVNYVDGLLKLSFSMDDPFGRCAEHALAVWSKYRSKVCSNMENCLFAVHHDGPDV